MKTCYSEHFNLETSVYQFPGVTSGKAPESHRKKETLEVTVWIINDCRKLPKVLMDALLPEVFNTRPSVSPQEEFQFNWRDWS